MNVIPFDYFRAFESVRDIAKRKQFPRAEAMKLAREALKQGENPKVVAYQIAVMPPMTPNRGDAA